MRHFRTRAALAWALVSLAMPAAAQTQIGPVTPTGPAGTPSSKVVTVQGTPGATPVVTTLTGTPSVSVANLPSTQAVSGSVSVTNLPSTQAVTGSVSVTNLPSTQTIAGTVTANVQGGNTSAVKVDGSGVTQPISGAVAITGTPAVSVSNFPATQNVACTSGCSGSSSTVAQGSATAGQAGGLTQAAVTSAPPNYTSGQTDPLSLTPAGALRVDGSAITQPVSGSVTATISGTPSVSVSNLPSTQAVSAAALPLPAGAATSANQPALNGDGGALAHVTNFPATQAVSGTVTANVAGGNATAVKVDGSSVTQPISGAVTATISGTPSVSVSNFPGTQAVSASALPLPSGAATAGNQTNVQSAPGSSASTALTVQGSASGVAIPVSGAVTVSGTVTANAGTNLNTSALALESGGNLASTATNTGTAATDLGAPGATACTTDTGSCSLNALFQRNNQRITSLIGALGSPFQAGGSIGNTSFGISGTLPAFAATPTFNCGTGCYQATQAVSGTVTANISGSISNTSFAATQATAANLNATVVGTGTFPVQNTAATPAGSNVIGGVTIADGSDTTLGAKADAAWTSGSGSMVALLKAIDRDTLLPLATGSNVIGAVAASPVTTNPTSTLTLPATTTAYASGQLMANSATAGSVVVPSFSIANSAGGAFIPILRLSTNDSTSTAWGGVKVQVDLWTAAPTFNNGDRGTWSPATGTASHLRSYTCTFSAEYGDGAYAECAPAVGSFALPKLASGALIYWTLETAAASGVTGASKVFTLTAEVSN